MSRISGNIKLSEGAIDFLQNQDFKGQKRIILEVDFTLQIEKAVLQGGDKVYNCHLLDRTSKYGGFLLQYDSNDGLPGIGDIVHIEKIIIAKLPHSSSNAYYCKNVKLIRRSMPLQVDPNKVVNLSKKKLDEEYENTVYNRNQSNNKRKNESNENKKNKNSIFDDSKCSLISQLTSFDNKDKTFYLKCKQKGPVKSGKSSQTQKDYVLITFTFEDTKGDLIQATAFNKAAEMFKDKIKEGEIYEIKKALVQSYDKRFYNSTKSEYKLAFYETTTVTKVKDNGKFCGVTLNFVPIREIIDIPLGKIIDVFGFVLADSTYQEFTSKAGKEIKNRRIIIGDDSLSKIEITLWGNLANPEDNFSLGDLMGLSYAKVKDYGGKKNLNSSEISEIIKTVSEEKDQKLLTFYSNHQDINEYSEIPGESVSTGNQRPAESAFIEEIVNSFQEEIDNKDRPYFQFTACCLRLDHSERNFYTGCAKCKKKMETDICNTCSGTEKKVYYTLSFLVRDCSGKMWVDMFGDVAEKFLGIKAEAYQQLLENGEVEQNEELMNITNEVTFKNFDFFGKVRENDYNMQKRHRFSVYRFEKFDNKKGKNLAKLLEKLLK